MHRIAPLSFAYFSRTLHYRPSFAGIERICLYNTILIVDTCSTNVDFAIYLQKDAIHKFLDDSIACRITKAVNEI